jgi:hypothetical protein
MFQLERGRLAGGEWHHYSGFGCCSMYYFSKFERPATRIMHYEREENIGFDRPSQAASKTLCQPRDFGVEVVANDRGSRKQVCKARAKRHRGGLIVARTACIS